MRMTGRKGRAGREGRKGRGGRRGGGGREGRRGGGGGEGRTPRIFPFQPPLPTLPPLPTPPPLPPPPPRSPNGSTRRSVVVSSRCSSGTNDASAPVCGRLPASSWRLWRSSV